MTGLAKALDVGRLNGLVRWLSVPEVRPDQQAQTEQNDGQTEQGADQLARDGRRPGDGTCVFRHRAVCVLFPLRKAARCAIELVLRSRARGLSISSGAARYGDVYSREIREFDRFPDIYQIACRLIISRSRISVLICSDSSSICAWCAQKSA